MLWLYWIQRRSSTRPPHERVLTPLPYCFSGIWADIVSCSKRNAKKRKRNAICTEQYSSIRLWLTGVRVQRKLEISEIILARTT